MFAALDAGRHLITQFGGHAQAAGLSLPKENLPLLKQHLESLAKQLLTEFDLQQKIAIEAALPLGDVNKKLVLDLGLLEPFGNENEAPVFVIERVQLMQAPQLLKDAHVKCMVFAEGVIKPVIFFNRAELYELMLDNQDRLFDMAVRVTQNYWQSRMNIELIGVDLAIAQERVL